MNFRKITVLFLILTSALFSGAEAKMNTARQSHASTLLADGNILITGGVIDAAGTPTAKVEMYNMATNVYENWPDMAFARSSHTATLMSDGRVLVAGGFNAGTPLNTIEICDPTLKTCVNSGLTLSTPRGGHTATLLDKGPNAGQVLLCGGQNAAAATSITGSCDLFNPVGPAITAAGPMIYPRMGHAATSLYSGKVFVTGGKVWDPSASGGAAWLYMPATEIYDPIANSWSNGSDLLQGRIDHTVTVLNNGVIMIAGGYNAANVLTCNAADDITKNECWHLKKGILAGNASIIAQNAGSHGYLDGAEFFDQKGGRTVLGESTYGVTPYRSSKHTAALMPDGSWNMFGGYGGIVPTFFTNAPNLTADSIIYTNNTGANTASIVGGTSIIKFPLIYTLSRPISGRLVDADTFISPPATAGSASIATDNVSLFLGKSTAPLDGTPVGTLISPDALPGDFNYLAKLQNPAGTAVFGPGTISSDGSLWDTRVITSNFTIPTLYPGDSSKPLSGNMTVWIAFTLPDLYKGIHGTASLQSGTIADLAMTYQIMLKKGGSVALNIPAPNSCNAVLNTCLYITTAVINGVQGTISNLTDITAGTTFYTNLQTAGAPVLLDLDFNYTADEIHFDNRTVAYNFDQSTTVVREMIYSTELGFTPNTGTWKDLKDTTISPTLAAPTFDQTTMVTPAADTVVIGGRNCETLPAASCLRSPASIFSPISTYTVLVPVLQAPDGTTTWPNGPKLNSKRAFHTSTVLLTGQVLTCGGSDGAHNLATCELMDPQTKAWTPTGSMNYPRSLHTATLLPNGTVLAAGGVTTDGTSINYAEIFYPDTQRWVLTSPMAQKRNSHTATLLPDGNVLVAGGDSVSSAEVFISSNASWQTVGPMTMGRSQHTATLLKSGDVLIVGGSGGSGGGLYKTEIYSFANQTFGAGPDLSTPRYGHTANLLKDGRVIVIGGSNNKTSGITAEIYNGATWVSFMDPVGQADLILNMNRTNHRSVLLPNGKVMVTGGETSGAVQSRAESYDPDFSNWSDQGKMTGRSGHTSVLTRDNYLINIGGWDGIQNLDTTDITYFSYSPDAVGLAAETTRQMIISTATAYFDHGMWATLLSSAANFHGVTEASGGGAGPRNSSFSNPRVYMTQIDNPSGFMIDLSTRIYSIYGGQNTLVPGAWANTLSSITIMTPSLPGEMPYGWYTMRVAANGLFSAGVPVQVTIPRPLGTPSVPVGTVLGVSSITWSWNRGTIPFPGGADGYNIYASSNDVFVATTAFTNTASYTQTGLRPNTEASLMVNSYNIGGTGPLARSTTYYTLASSPTALTITKASFEIADLTWGNNNNTDGTIYELSMYACGVGASLVNCALTAFSDPVGISTPIPVNSAFTSTFTETNQLTPNRGYFFRVRAFNGGGLPTVFSNIVSTLTVGNVSNLTGTAISSAAISWSWDESEGADAYNIYNVSAGTNSVVFVGSTTVNYLTQSGLSANQLYSVAVNAVKNGPPQIMGPPAYSGSIYTLAVQPGLMASSFLSVTTGSITTTWLTNGNSPLTMYQVQLSTVSVYTSSTTVSISTNSSSAVFNGLSANVGYYARVYALNGDGVASAPTALGYKFTRARAPASVTPSLISMSGVTLTWDQNGNSPDTIYEVRYTTETFDLSVTTYVPFSAGFTGNSVAFPGLLTGTTYYFDVAARNFDTTAPNGAGYVTARIQAVPAAYTLAGPSGAPSGSVGGTSNPAKDVTISGTLPTGRAVAMYIPAPTYPAATAIAISTSAENPCNYSGVSIEVQVYSQSSAEPQAPVTLTLSYNAAEANAVNTNLQSMLLARYNPVSGQCLPLETAINTGLRTITSTLNYFAMPGYNSSIFQLMLKTAATDLSNVLIYPNPLYVNRGQGFVTINNMPASASVRIYTLSGVKVWEGKADTTGILIWKGDNKAGFLVASGIYLAVIDSSAGKKVLKLAVER